MSERGVFAVDRGIFDHEMFAREPFTEREAWIWLIKEAAWKPRKVRVGKCVASLDRGQCAHSLRFMADIWQWNRCKVERFVNRLKTETLIETHSETGVTVITVCKYSEYQRVSLPRETATETQTEEPPRQLRDKPEDTKLLEDKKEDIGAVAPADSNVVEFADPKKYEFDGETIKATPKTMATFRKDFQSLPDLVATLRVVDVFYTHQKPLADKSKWYFPVYKWLEKANAEAKAAYRESRRGIDWG